MHPSEKIAVVGLGYVGLPVAAAFARRFPDTVGFDIDARRVAELGRGVDRTGELSGAELQASGLQCTTDPERMRGATFFVVTVPTPVDQHNHPDLRPVRSASESVGRVIGPGAVVVFESTVYPGVTEEICGPIIERVSGLKSGRDFFLGYSPERINPGDKEHRLETITKVVSGQDAATLDRVAAAYGRIIKAGIHRAPTIKVAEAAKVIENTQRDLNIALMNELALIFDRLDIRTQDVLEAAGTKWNFLKFRPGLVGGHCIGVDPYYLTMKAQEVGYFPEVILAGRRTNDGMGRFVAQKLVKLMANSGLAIRGARVGVLGLTFKEDVPDLRNSKVPDIVRELESYGISVLLHDPLADSADARHEYGLELTGLSDLRGLDGLIAAVSHAEYRDSAYPQLSVMVREGGAIVDVKSVIPADLRPAGRAFWCL